MKRITRTRGLGTVTLICTSFFGFACTASAQVASSNTAGSSAPLRIVVPFPAGTAVDILARDLSNHLQAALGRPVVVDNKAGAGGNIGTEFVVNAPPDGSTILLTVNTTVNINPMIYEKIKYKPSVDLVPIASLSKSGYVLASGPKFPHGIVSELIAAAKKQPDTLTYASYGYGTMAHVCMERFQQVTGTRLRHVPFRSAFAPDLMAGVVDVAFENLAPAIPWIKEKKLKALAVTYARVGALPDVPALSESVPNFECFAWAGIFAPKGTSSALQKQLGEEITKIVRSPAYVALADRLGSIPAPMERKDFEQFVKSDEDMWRRLIPPLNIKLD